MGVSTYTTDMMTEEGKKRDGILYAWRKRMKKGDCFIECVSTCLSIYGKVLKVRTTGENKSFYYCLCFSGVCPEGEKREVHLSQISRLIEKETFDTTYASLNNGKKPEIE